MLPCCCCCCYGCFLGANLEAKDAKEYTPLHLATVWDQPQAIHELAAAGADLNSQDLQQHTPLHLAASLQQLRALDALVAAGAGSHSRNKDGQTPLHVAAARGRLQSIKALVVAGAGHNLIDGSNLKRTPLALALQRGQAAAALELLLAGAQPGPHRDLPLHMSMRNSLMRYFERQMTAATTEREQLRSVRRNVALLLMRYGVAGVIHRLLPDGPAKASAVAAAAAEKLQRDFVPTASSCSVRSFCRGLSRMAEAIQLVRGEVASLEGVSFKMQQGIVVLAQAWRDENPAVL